MQTRRNGSRNGQSKYQCTACRYQGLFVPAAVRKAAQCAQVDARLSGRHSQRSIARLTGVARMTIAKRIKKRLLLHRPLRAPFAAPAAAVLVGSPAQAVGSARTR